MSFSDAFLGYARKERLAPLAFAAAPAWLWLADGTRIVWANAAGAVALGASSPAVLAARQFDASHPAAREVIRLRAALPAAGAVQLARLRGLAPSLGRPITCTCSRWRLDDGSAAVLIAGAETVKPILSLAERARRSLADAPKVLAFAPDGALLHAGASAATRLAGRATLAALGAEQLMADALATGYAEGETDGGRATLERLGAGDAAVLLAAWEGAQAEQVDDGAKARTAPEATSHADTRDDSFWPTAAASGQPDRAETDASPGATVELATGLLSADGAIDPIEQPRTVEHAPPAPAPGGAGALLAAALPSLTHAEALATLDAAQERLVGRRHPLRFVWTIDADGGFTIEPGEFTALAGSPTAAVQGRRWDVVAPALGLDPEGRLLRAIASHDTWSGVTVAWPVEAAAPRLPVLLSGLPVLDRDRSFRGYRGFGVCRDVARIAAVIAAQRVELERDPRTPRDPSADAAVTSPPASEQAPSEIGPAIDEPPVPETQATDFPLPARPPRESRAQLTVVPTAQNVVPLRAGLPVDKRPTLSAVERNAFQEIARALGARLEAGASTQSAPEAPSAAPDDDPPPASNIPERGSEDADVQVVDVSGAAQTAEAQSSDPHIAAVGRAPAQNPAPDEPGPPSQITAVPAATVAPTAPAAGLERLVLDRLPVAVIAFRGEEILLANRTLLEWTGYASREAIADAGGLEALMAGPVEAERTEPEEAARALSLRTADGTALPVDARLFKLACGEESALMLALTRAGGDERHKQLELALRAAEATVEELRSILDTATDGVVVVDQEGCVVSANRSAEALFGYDAQELRGRPLADLFAPESQRSAADYLEGLTRSGVASLLNDGREVIGRVRQGGLIPLFMTMGRIGEEPARFCAVLRDITQWKRAEEELTNAKRQAERASSAKSDFLAKISHEIRTALNAIIGFSEVMMEQRFGPMANERYRGYAKDIHTSGEHMISLLNDLLDLSKIEAGKIDLVFTRVDLNDVMQQCVAIMQPQANRERIIIRTALSSILPPVVADARSVRQIVLNLLSNSIKFTGAGGQVIVSTALTDAGEAVLRVRDTGEGMSEKDIETALEPFRQLPTAARIKAAGTGLGLPLTKALAEANRAEFRIQSAVNAGTLVEIVFPATRVLAE